MPDSFYVNLNFFGAVVFEKKILKEFRNTCKNDLNHFPNVTLLTPGECYFNYT
jgi:hypothetical protein